MAVWADALGVPGQWPFFDLAVVFEPSVENDPVWMEHLEADSGHKLWTRSRQVVADMFRWASLGDRPKERFPGFDDPYEPMIQLLCLLNLRSQHKMPSRSLTRSVEEAS
ncbi:MAG TPA: hypothetical protein VGD15_25410 [Kribbella sp.]|jgi:hypothetical protein